MQHSLMLPCFVVYRYPNACDHRGFNSTDNGFMRFTHVRVPLDRMLMGVATVSESGDYKRVPGGDKRSYGSMLDVRANLVSTQYFASSIVVAM
jgi:hypothetical protein